MASLTALAAAVRDRLLAEEPAPLPGFGTLRRVRVPARVETRPDGSRSLTPPSETLRLVLGQEPDADPLALALARELGLPVAQGRTALKQHVDQLEALLSAVGEVKLEGVGIVRRTDRGVLFGADPGLLATINRSYEGLTPVGTPPEAADDEPAAPEGDAPAPTEASMSVESAESTAASGDERELEVHAPPTEQPTDEPVPEPRVDDELDDKPTESEASGEPPAPPFAGDGGGAGASIGNVVISAPTTGAPADELDDEVDASDEAASADDLFASHDAAPPAAEAPVDDTEPLADDPFVADEPEVMPLSEFSIVPLPETSKHTGEPEAEEPEAEEPAAFSLPAAPATPVVPPVSLDDGPTSAEDTAPSSDAAAEPATEADAPDDLGDLLMADPLEMLDAAPPEASAPDAPEENEPADAATAVDDLLSGVWTAGTPAVGSLGLSSPPDPEPEEIEDAEYDMIEPLASPPAEAPASPDAPLNPDVRERLRQGGLAGLSAGRPEGLPAMPAGWTPVDSPSDDEPGEYEPMERERSGGVPVWVGVAVALLLLTAVAAVFLWPRLSGGDSAPQSAEAPVTPEAVEPGVADSPEDDAAADAEDPAADSLGAGVPTAADPAPLAADASAALNGASGGSGSTAGGAASAGASVPAPRTTPASATGPVEARQRPLRSAGGQAAAMPRVPTDDPLAPDLSGLSPALASALAGSAPIQLDVTGYTWVVASVADRAEAADLMARYRRAGYRTRLIEGEYGGRPTFRVAIGQFATRNDAISVRDRLPADIRGRDDIWTLNLADV